MQRNVYKRLHRQQFLMGHEEELFVHYYETMGSARSTGKLAGYCVTKGWINRQTRKAPSRMAVWFAMWRWAIRRENQSRAYKMYQSFMLEDGHYCDKDEWKALLYERAEVCLRDKDFERWKVENVSLS